VFRANLPLLPPRKVPWKLKPLDSAETSLSYDDCGRMVMHIRHSVIKGVTPEMLAWWFAHIGGDMELEGKTVNKYLVWHPLDHILWELAQPAPDGGAGVGAKFRIVEAFGRNPDHYVDVTDTVVRLSPAGFTLHNYRLGMQIARLNHDFGMAEGGASYESTLTVGTSLSGLRTVVNPLVHGRLFTEAMGYGWLKHNVEEVGLLEHILPLVYPGAEMPRAAIRGT
jgi:hypothetical protein